MAEHKSHTHGSHGSKTTTDHDEIREWAEARGAKPAHVKSTGSKSDVGLLRLDFPGYSGADSLEHIEWDEFFEKFDEANLALVYQEETADGETSNFNKLVSRDAEEGSSPKPATAKAAAAKSSASRSTAAKSPAKKSTAAKAKTSKASGKH